MYWFYGIFAILSSKIIIFAIVDDNPHHNNDQNWHQPFGKRKQFQSVGVLFQRICIKFHIKNSCFFVTLCCTTWCLLQHIVYPYCYHQCAPIAQFMHSKNNWSHIQNIKKPMVIQSWLREYWVEYSIHTIIQSKYGKQETTGQICISCKMKLRQNETECHHKTPQKRSIRTTKNWTNTKKH